VRALGHAFASSRNRDQIGMRISASVQSRGSGVLDGSRQLAIIAGTILFMGGGLRPAAAADLNLLDGDLTGSFDTTITLGISARTGDRSDEFVGVANGGDANSINADDGNLNYDQGDITSARAKATHELDLNWKNYGFFGRLFYFYDTAIMDSDTERTDLSDQAENRSGRDIELLDAFVTGDFDIADRPVSVRLGNQVISWGESTFIQNGINVINPVDVSKLRVAGAELRDALEPIPAINLKVGLTDRLSLEGFYQFYWEQTEIEPAGTFFSTNDFASPGGNLVFLGFGQPGISDNPPTIGANPPIGSAVPRASDKHADDQGQFGFALRYFEPALNDTEFGLYYIRYHSRRPVLSARTGTVAGLIGGDYASSAAYFREFPEDIDLIGASFNTEIGTSGWALQGEVAYRFDQPLQIDDTEILAAGLSPLGFPFTTNQIGVFGFDEEIQGYRTKDVVQGQATASKLLGPTLEADQVVILGEVGATFIRDMEDKSELRYEGPATFTSGNSILTMTGVQPETQNDGFADEFSWGYRLLTRADYNNAIGPINLHPQIAFAHDVHGTTPAPISNFVEDRKTITLTLGATYLNSLRAELSYTNFFDGEFNMLKDRDFLSLTVSYSF
jgi:hypothetical protein